MPLTQTDHQYSILKKLDLCVLSACPACPACPVAPADGTGVAPADGTGVAPADGTGVSPEDRTGAALCDIRYPKTPIGKNL